MGRREHPDPLLLQTVSARLARLLEEATPRAEPPGDPPATVPVAPANGSALPEVGVPLEFDELPPRPRFRRVHVGVVAALLLAGLLWSGWSVLRARPVALVAAPAGPLTPVMASADPGSPAASGPAPSPSDPPSAGGEPGHARSAGAPPGAPRPAGRVVVHVHGAVRSPGLVALPGQSRVQDAVDAAGGLTRHADPGELNLAQVLQDGQQVLIGTRRRPDGQVRGGGGAGAGPGSTATGSPGAVVDLNRADTVQLEGLPGVGPVTAAAILAWRSEHGRFRSVEELQEVDGIGPKTFAQIVPHVRV